MTDALLLHFNGVNGATTTTDSSALVVPVTMYPPAAITTAKKKFGSAGIATYPSGSDNGGFSVPYDAAHPLSLGAPWTVEGWAYVTSAAYGDTCTLFTNFDGVSGGISIRHSAGRLYMEVPSIDSISVGGVFADTWFHWAVTHSQFGFALYVNGNPEFLDDTYLYYETSVADLTFGKDVFPVEANAFNGYMDEIRISTVVKYAAIFTPDTGPFTPSAPSTDTGTSLLLHFDGSPGTTTFTDDSGRGRTVVGYNGAVLQATESKFGGSAVQIPKTGSMVLLNTEYLKLSSEDSWTIEGFFKLLPGSTSYDTRVLVRNMDPTYQAGFSLDLAGTDLNFVDIGQGGVSYNCAVATVGVWQHFALVFDGSNFNVYLQGVRTILDATWYVPARTNIDIGGSGTTAGLNGYLDELRFSRSAIYTSAFTSPSSPFVTDTTGFPPPEAPINIAWGLGTPPGASGYSIDNSGSLVAPQGQTLHLAPIVRGFTTWGYTYTWDSPSGYPNPFTGSNAPVDTLSGVEITIPAGALATGTLTVSAIIEGFAALNDVALSLKAAGNIAYWGVPSPLVYVPDLPRFNTEFRYGLVGGPEFSTTITRSTSGHGAALAHWDTPLSKWTTGSDLYTREELHGIYQFFMTRRGKAELFRFKAWEDFECELGQGAILMDATNVRLGQLQKKYVHLTTTIATPIKRPVYGTIVVLKNGDTLTENAVGAGYVLDYSKGLISFTEDIAPTDVLQWYGEFDKLSRFTTDHLQCDFVTFREEDGERLFNINGLGVQQERE